MVDSDYQFNICNSENASPIGRTKTTPSKGDKVNTAIKIAVYSCSNTRSAFSMPLEIQPEKTLSTMLYILETTYTSTRTENTVGETALGQFHNQTERFTRSMTIGRELQLTGQISTCCSVPSKICLDSCLGRPRSRRQHVESWVV